MTKPLRPRPYITRLYRNATIGFFAVAVVIAGAIAFISFQTTTIEVGVKARTVSKTATLTVAAEPKEGTDERKGFLDIRTIDGSKSADVPDSGSTVDDYAHGTVTIRNDWTKPQPLAAKTRLKASSNGLIYRTTARVDVPVGGTVQAEVVADTAGAGGNIGPDRFEIVALWPGLKDKIFGTSENPMTGGTRASSQLSQASIDETTKTLKEELIAEAATTTSALPNGMVAAGTPFALDMQSSASAKAGDQVQSYTVSGTLTYALVGIDRQELAEATDGILKEALPENATARGDVHYAWTLNTVDRKAGTAVLDLTVTTAVRLSQNDAVLHPERFAGKTKGEIEKLLRATEGVANAAVTIAPFWAKKSPSSESRIRVVVYDAS